MSQASGAVARPVRTGAGQTHEFGRKDDYLTTVLITFAEAVLGVDLRLPTLDVT